MQLSVIIVNYNVRFFLEQCLHSVIKATVGIEAEIWVVDNQSSDGSQTFLPQQFPRVHFIWNDTNLGFSKANNQALERAVGDYILFLNPDTIVAEDTFRICLDFFSRHPDAGALGIRMVDGAGQFLKESKRAFPSPLTSLYKLSGLAQLFPRSAVFARYHLGHLSEKENQVVDVLAGAFMFIPRAVLQQTGSFDEGFFMYGEDVDLSYRIQKAVHPQTGIAYQNYYVADSSIIHFKGESTKKGSLNYVRLFYKAMSQFVQKHYTDSSAGLFNAFVQTAIWGRAVLSALSRVLQKIGLPLLDAAIILLSFWGVKWWWNHSIRNDVSYSPNMLGIAFPVYGIIFLLASYYSGLYDRGYRQAQLNRSTFMATLLLLSGYALLPESLRFSRGILVFGVGAAFVAMSMLRWCFIRWRVINAVSEDDENRQTVIVAGETTYHKVMTLMQEAGMQERVLGRVSGGDAAEKGTLGNTTQLVHLVKMYPVKEVIFCENGLSFKDIIGLIQQLPPGVRCKFHASGSSSIVGSDSKDMEGEYLTPEKKYTIGQALNRRNKNLIDVSLALLLMVTLPVHLFFQKKPLGLIRNIFMVLFRQKSWVGYAGTANHLPALRPGVLTSTALPHAINTLPAESLQVSDEWYATGFSVYTDLRKMARGYPYLGY